MVTGVQQDRQNAATMAVPPPRKQAQRLFPPGVSGKRSHTEHRHLTLSLLPDPSPGGNVVSFDWTCDSVILK